MINFEFMNPTKLVFGPERHAEAGKLIGRFGAKKVLVVFGGGSVVRSGLLGRIEDSIREAGFDFLEFGGVEPNPKVSLVRKGIALCRAEGVDFVLAVGGGSVIDSAKAIAIGAVNDVDIWDIYSGSTVYDSALPVGVVLTIPGSGSESGSGSVISNEETQQKYLYSSDAIRPVFCIIDPSLFLTIPEKTRWPSIFDMMSHVMERYFTNTPRAELTDGLCEATLRNLIRNARRLHHGENTIDVWGELALSANVAHNGVCGMGRRPDWACHGMEHEISAVYGVPHGAGLAVITPAWMKVVYKDNIPLFAQFAVNVMDTPMNRNLEEVAREGIRRMESLIRSFGLPTTMEELGVLDDSMFETMAKRSVLYDQFPDYKAGAVKPIGWQEAVEIFKQAQAENAKNW